MALKRFGGAVAWAGGMGMSVGGLVYLFGKVSGSTPAAAAAAGTSATAVIGVGTSILGTSLLLAGIGLALVVAGAAARGRKSNRSASTTPGAPPLAKP